MLRPRRRAAPVTSTVRGRGGEVIGGTIGRVTSKPTILPSALQTHVAKAIAEAGGWIGFDRFMALALYTPGLGYYAGDLPKFGAMPASGSDFVTAPELSPVFGRVLARQVREALDATTTDEVWEFGAGSGALAWADRPTDLRPPVEVEGPHDYLTEIHPQGEAFMRTLAQHLVRGAAFLIDYGFGEDEYYHPQRHMGTLVCHRGHQVDSDPLADVGLKDITAHVNFTAMALAAQDAGLQVLGYTTQAHFLINCGLLSELERLTQAQRAQAAKLMMEHEMGELFKVLAVGAGAPWRPMGFAQGDRSHRL